MVATRGLPLEKKTGEQNRDPGANAADKEEPCELPCSPDLLQFRPEHPESQHVEKNVKDVAGVVQKDVCDELPDVTVCDAPRNQAKHPRE
jgi:hypothetical protein